MKKARRYITVFAMAVFFMSLCSVRSSWTAIILCAASWIWLAVEAYRSGWFYEPEKDEVDYE